MTDENDYFANLSERRRAPLRLLFTEYQAIKDIHRAVSAEETARLFQAIIDRETDIAENRISTPSVFGNQTIPASYADEWWAAFIETAHFYRQRIRTYSDAIAAAEEFCQPLACLTDMTTGSVADQLMSLAKEGFGADILGSREAHWQIGNILQIYFGRYSFDRRDAPRQKQHSLFDHNAPRPSLQSFQRRQNMRATITGDHGHIDPHISYALYIDRLGEAEDIDLPTWKARTRSFYERQILLMPGLEETKNLWERVKLRFNGKIHDALQALQNEAGIWLRDMQAGQPVDYALKEARHDYAVASLGHSALCFFNTFGGYVHAGGGLRPMIASQKTPDVYSIGEINYDWNAVIEEWARQDAAKAAMPKQPPKTQSEKRLQKLALLKAREEKARADFAQAQAALSEREKREKERKAAIRRIETQQRQAAREIARRKQKRDAAAAARKAELTRINNQKEAQARQEQAREARRIERENRAAQTKWRSPYQKKLVKRQTAAAKTDSLRQAKKNTNKPRKKLTGMGWRESKELLKDIRVSRHRRSVRVTPSVLRTPKF